MQNINEFDMASELIRIQELELELSELKNKVELAEKEFERSKSIKDIWNPTFGPMATVPVIHKYVLVIVIEKDDVINTTPHIAKRIGDNCWCNQSGMIYGSSMLPFKILYWAELPEFGIENEEYKDEEKK